MRGQNKTKDQLINELDKPRHRIIEEGQLEGTRKQTEEALRESESYYRTLVQNLPPKIFLKDKNSVYLSCNENFSRDLKMRPAEIAGKTDYDFYPGKLAEKYRADDKRIMESGKTGDVEEKYIQDGMEMIIHKVKAPVKDEKGKITGILGIFWDITESKHADDELKKYRERLEELVEERTAELRNANEQLQREITERKEAEKALRMSEERYRTLFEESRDAIFITSREGEILDANQSMLDLFGYSKEEIVDFNTRETYIHPEDRLKFQQVIEREGFVRDYEIKLRKKDRTEMECLLTTIVRKTADGKIAGYRGIIRDITERKQAEEEYRTILRTTMDGFWIVDMRGRFLDTNDAYCRLIGYSRDELLTMRIQDVEAIERPEETAQRIQRIMETGGDCFETRHRCKDGRLIDIEVCVNYTEVGGGQLFVFLRNITERKKAEEALRLASTYNRSLIEASLDPLVTIGPDGKVTDVNVATEKVTGYSRKELIGTDFMGYFSEPERAKAGYQEVFQQGFVQDYALEIRHKDGHLTPVLYNASVYRDEAGQVIGVFAAARDITERKRTEKALQESEKRYREVVEKATEIIYTVDEKGNFTYANPAGLKATGYSLEELRGFNYMDLVLPEHRERVTETYVNQFRQKISTTHIEFPFFNKPGGITWFGQNATLIIEDGRVAGFHIIARDITERKKAEEVLRESEARYRDLIETARDVIFTLSPEGVLTSFNPAFETITGWSAKEWIGKVFVDLVDPNDVPKATERFKTVTEGQSVETTELRIRTKDGGVVYGEFVASPQVKEGKVIGVLGIARDITKRKKAEEALRNSEEKYRTILENIEDGYYEVDIAGNFTFFNNSFCRIYGYPREELMGMNDRQYTDQENAKKLFQTFNRVYRTGESAKGTDWEIIRKDGMKRNIGASVSLIKDSSGNRIGFRGLVRDITERKQAEEQLSKLFRAVEQSPATVMITDTNANIEYVNPKFTQLTGYTMEEVIGKNPRILKSGETPQEEYKLLWETITSGKEWRGEFHDKKKNGEFYWEAASISSVKNPEGVITHYVAVKEDITERKRAEEERATLQEQLRQSQKMEAIGQLAGGVAHDFNNLLTVIKGYCQLSLAEMQENTPIKDALELINKASEKAAGLTRQLLAFSRRQIMQVTILDPNTLLRNLDKMLRRIIGEDIELVTLLGEDLGRVKADPGQIEQVVMNLAVNAKDAMSKGGKLTIETTNVELDEAYAHAHVAVTPGPYVMIAVSDTGTGMTPEVRDRVFEPFFTTKGKGKGTGLGLSTVYGIVKQSGGNIWVYSELGQGTTLKIYLPRVDEPAERLKAEVVGEEFPRGGETILIVEDDKEVRNLAARILKRQGYTVLDGSYGAEAFNACRQHKGPIHLLVTDVVMPGMDGRALASSLSQLHPEMKVLYMSGYTTNSILHHGVLAEGINFLQKPFTVDTLAKKVREVLDKNSKPTA